MDLVTLKGKGVTITATPDITNRLLEVESLGLKQGPRTTVEYSRDSEQEWTDLDRAISKRRQQRIRW